VIVVSDTSPICYLTLIGCLDLLPKLFGHITVPSAVIRELGAPAAPEPVRELAIRLPGWLEVRGVATVIDATLETLHSGERDAIALAEELGADLIILDEKIARQVAVERGLAVTGLLGILAEGAARGIVDLPDAVARLRQTNFRVSRQQLRSLLDRSDPPVS
jgi:predicted nucleic acid-binding protein